MKILVINPPSFDDFKYVKEGRCESKKGGQLTPPVTLGIISALLTKNGYENDFYDMMAQEFSYVGIDNIFVKRYDVVFISISAPTFRHDVKTADLIRSKNKDCLICALGVLPTALPKVVLEKGFDICISQDPEFTSLGILNHYGTGTIDSIFRNVKNIYYCDDEGVVRFNGKENMIQNLDSLPFPARDRMPLDKYINPRTAKPFTAIKLQRGCPYGCSFCTAPFYYGKKPRHRSVSNIIDEIKECVEKYNISDFLFLSDTFTINHSFVKDLCGAIIEKNMDITWSCNSRVDTFNNEIAKVMKKAGCWFISFGVESASKKIIEQNFKNLDPKKAVDAAKICRQTGIKSMMYYILGFPGETKNDMKNTIDLALQVNSDMARFFVATPLPGSKLYDKYHAESFDHINLSDYRANLSDASDEELNKMIKYAYLRFYARPKQIIKTMDVFENKKCFIDSGINYMKAYILNK